MFLLNLLFLRSRCDCAGPPVHALHLESAFAAELALSHDGGTLGLGGNSSSNFLAAFPALAPSRCARAVIVLTVRQPQHFEQEQVQQRLQLHLLAESHPLITDWARTAASPRPTASKPPLSARTAFPQLHLR